MHRISLYCGISIDIFFNKKPSFGDLFLICGESHPNFPPTTSMGFENLSELQFVQVDDYFGVRALIDEGDEVPIWLFPLVNNEMVYHHPGPFDGVRLSYTILRNPIRRAEHYIKCVRDFAALANRVFYKSRKIELGVPPNLSVIREDINSVSDYWASQGITVGSAEALKIDY